MKAAPGAAFGRAIGSDHDRQSVGRGRGDIDVRRPRVVERDGEDLADLRGRRRIRFRRPHQLRLRPAAHVLQIDDAERRALEIDEGLVVGIGAGRHRTGAGAHPKIR
jgi:hypothetical protein